MEVAGSGSPRVCRPRSVVIEMVGVWQKLAADTGIAINYRLIYIYIYIAERAAIVRLSFLFLTLLMTVTWAAKQKQKSSTTSCGVH